MQNSVIPGQLGGRMGALSANARTALAVTAVPRFDDVGAADRKARTNHCSTAETRSRKS
ncbi:hypothetical protein [Acidocella aminolytica]|uniref:hypothetical protein n=1 Tax=Acidocella aminolytica TaxID=33998 RepID=UPI0015877C76|nr:hypothetical protein [Acidocella aminolytica]